jgi:hypothetical protein
MYDAGQTVDPRFELWTAPLQLVALHASCRRTSLRDRGPRSILIVRCRRRSALRPPDAAWSSVEDAGAFWWSCSSRVLNAMG